MPDNLVYDVKYYDIVVTESNVYITYNGCINRNGNSRDYRRIQLNSDLNIYGSTGLASAGYYSISWEFDTQTLFAYNDYSSGSIDEYYIVPASVHTLLPEPVNPVNTMKIQYDFTCDYVYPLDMPAH